MLDLMKDSDAEAHRLSCEGVYTDMSDTFESVQKAIESKNIEI